MSSGKVDQRPAQPQRRVQPGWFAFVRFVSAFADASQEGFDAKSVLAQKRGPKKDGPLGRATASRIPMLLPKTSIDSPRAKSASDESNKSEPTTRRWVVSGPFFEDARAPENTPGHHRR